MRALFLLGFLYIVITTNFSAWAADHNECEVLLQRQSERLILDRNEIVKLIKDFQPVNHLSLSVSATEAVDAQKALSNLNQFVEFLLRTRFDVLQDLNSRHLVKPLEVTGVELASQTAVWASSVGNWKWNIASFRDVIAHHLRQEFEVTLQRKLAETIIRSGMGVQPGSFAIHGVDALNGQREAKYFTAAARGIYLISNGEDYDRYFDLIKGAYLASSLEDKFPRLYKAMGQEALNSYLKHFQVNDGSAFRLGRWTVWRSLINNGADSAGSLSQPLFVLKITCLVFPLLQMCHEDGAFGPPFTVRP